MLFTILSRKESILAHAEFLQVFSFAETLVDGSQCYSELQSGVKPCFSVLQSGALCCCVSFVVCCDVHPGLVLNSMQDLGVEETPNGLDKPSAERNLTKR